MDGGVTPGGEKERFGAKLDRYDAFLPIAGQDGSGAPVRHYGGDQAWYRTKVGRYSGCGAVAAADIFAYLAQRDTVLAGLYGGDAAALTVDVFLKHMDDVIRFVRPSSIPYTDIPYGGLTSIPRFVRYCEAFAASRSVPLKAVFRDNRALSYEQAVEEVRTQLDRDNPVAMLNMRNDSLKAIEHIDMGGKPAVSDLRFHWVVLTALEGDGGVVTATASSEGCRVRFDFRDAWTCNAKSPFGWRGIVYFVSGNP